MEERFTALERPEINRLGAFVNQLQSQGRYTFTRDDAVGSLGVSSVAFQGAVRRLAAKNRLVSPHQGFYVIVPLEYSAAGAPPPSWFLDDFMKFLGRRYYVGLLTAAALHGAAHQQPQEFQVITDFPTRPAAAGRARLRYFVKRGLEKTPTVQKKTETGAMIVSTPEATALDLVRYAGSLGDLTRIARVLAELSEAVQPNVLASLAQQEKRLPLIQRLGYLLETIGRREHAEPLAQLVAHSRPRHTSLNPSASVEGYQTDPRWRLYPNEQVEIEE
jgi:predicted transcriptional regulator of viral defense system